MYLANGEAETELRRTRFGEWKVGSAGVVAAAEDAAAVVEGEEEEGWSGWV